MRRGELIVSSIGREELRGWRGLAFLGGAVLVLAGLVHLSPLGFARLWAPSDSPSTFASAALLLAGLAIVAGVLPDARRRAAQTLLGGLLAAGSVAALTLVSAAALLGVELSGLLATAAGHGDASDRGLLASAVPLGFLFLGAAFVLAHRFSYVLRCIAVRTILAAVTAIAILGILAEIFAFREFFSSGVMEGMPAGTALGLAMAAIAAWSGWYREDWNRPLWIKGTDERIVFTFGLILAAAVTVVGVSSIVVVKNGIESATARELTFALQSRRDMIATVIERDISATVDLANRPGILRGFSLAQNAAQRPAAAEALREILNTATRHLSFDALSLLDAQGREITSTGKFSDSTSLQLDLAHVQPTMLLWDGELLMRTEAAVRSRGQLLGKVIAQHRMPELHGVLFDAEALGRSSEIEMCGSDGRHLHCAPTRFERAPHNRERVFRGSPTPMSLAMGGSTGVAKSVDGRGQRVLAAYTLMPRISLGLVLKTDLAEIYGPLHAQVAYLLLLASALVGTVVALLIWYVRPMAARLAASEYRLRLAVKGSQLVLWDWDCGTDRMWLGGNWSVLTGSSIAGENASTGRAAAEFVHPEDQASLRKAVVALLKGQVAHFDHEIRVRGVSGWIWLRAAGEVVARDAAGRATKAVGTAHDISRQKLGEDMLSAARDEAERTNAEKDLFLATVSHEIRTPLSGLLGMLELLSFTKLEDAQRKQIAIARDSGRAMGRIIDDLLDHAKIEAGKIEINPEPASPAQVLASVADTYRAVASTKNLVLSHHTDPRISPRLQFDPLRLTQVLGNLASNAVKFTSSGYIELRAEFVRREGDLETVRFLIRDTGIGMTQDEQSRLFRRFQQASTGIAQRYGGSGLGLSISRRLVELMRGEIGVVSAPGDGTTFTVTLALRMSAAAPDARLAAERAATDRSPTAYRVPVPFGQFGGEMPVALVADDNPTNRLLIEEQLKLLGVSAKLCGDGDSALKAWRTGQFAVLIADCNMPGLSGYELAREIRRIESRESRARTPILGWTASVMVDAINQCREAGMDNVLGKPASIEALRDALGRFGLR